VSISQEHINTVDTLFFDMDGTLFMSETVGPEAARLAVAKIYAEEGVDEPLPPKQFFLSQIGKPDMEYFSALLPDKYAHFAERVKGMVVQNELMILKDSTGAAFPQALETLAALKSRGYKMAIASNCGQPYFDAVCTSCGFDPYIDIRLCIGDRGFAPKSELISEMGELLESRAALLIGDRINDMEAAREAGIPFVAALWGYSGDGELDEADASVKTFAELLSLLPGVRR
jgi:phosphoglycolate phosphatase-like HAD superfamily hydrolase